MRGTYTVTIVNQLLYLARGEGLSLLKTKNLNFIVLVLQNLQLFLVVHQIHTLPSIYLKHAQIKFYILVV